MADVGAAQWLLEPLLTVLRWFVALPFLNVIIVLTLGGAIWRAPMLGECWKNFLDYRLKRLNSNNKFSLEQRKNEQEVTPRVDRANGRRRP